MAAVWFRKSLRLHDNAALTHAASLGEQVFPIFVLDPKFNFKTVGVNRYQFLLESLTDLDSQLREQHQSRLLVLRGSPEEIFKELFSGSGPFKIKSLFWEKDSEPYAQRRDANVEVLAKQMGIETRSFTGHTILDLDKALAAKNTNPPISMKAIQKIVESSGPVPKPLPTASIPPLDMTGFEVPQITDFYEEKPTATGFPGGEREALRRLKAVCSSPEYVCQFEKPKTASTGKTDKPWEPSTTGLSPYFKFGCLSVRTAWHAFAACQQGRSYTQPPQSLHGQLLFREMFYVLSVAVPNWDKDVDNSMCKRIPWDDDERLLTAWTEGKTGYPFIDALMRQLVQTGWMHHLGRHAVACFLTRGDLWQNWTKGRDVFDKYLLDSDWALNNGNWMWLAGVAPFSSPYFRVYDPSPGPKSSLNAEQQGSFVRHFVPELAKMPAKYIYKPWTAPMEVQRTAKCIIGKDYPAPIVEHSKVREQNIQQFAAALEELKCGRLPAKFGNAKDDVGPMKTRFTQATLSFKKPQGPIDADVADSSQDTTQEGAGGKRPSQSMYKPQPKRRWTKAGSPPSPTSV